MIKFKSLLALALLACTTAVLAADPPGQVGRLSYVQGTVSFAPADAGSDWTVAPINWPVTTGDRLWADRDGRAEMRIGANAIRAGALTSVDVLRLDDMATQLRLAQGTLNIRLRELDPGDSFEVSTPGGAVLLTRPGNYRISVDPAGATTSVLVRQGQADVLTGNAPVPLNDNQFISFSANGQDYATAPPPDEFDNWAYARDRQAENLVTTRYVSPAMTGYEELDQHGAWQSVAQYGNVWFPAAVPVGWAPYRYGRWVWVSPWGWTWLDNAPWGFAPYHYGRWVWIGGRWAWAPGARVARPVYSPALVAFIGGSNWSVSVGSGPAVGWVPLGWREPYIPWYRHTPTYVRNVNITHVTNVTVINQYTKVTNVRYVNRDVPAATTVVTRDTFVRARHVHDAHINVPARALAAAEVTHAAPVTPPGGRHSLAAAQPGARLPATIATREVVATRAPLAASQATQPGAADEHRPRVRVLSTAPPATIRTAPDAIPQAAPPAGRDRAAEREHPRPAPKTMVDPRPPATMATPAAPALAPVPGPGDGQRTQRHSAEPRAPVAVAPPPAPTPVPAPAAVPHDAPRIQRQAPEPRPPVAIATPTAPSSAPALSDAQRAQRQQERQARDEQLRQARAMQQQQSEQQRQQHNQMQQQRALAVQQQRDQQLQQAQQVEQQRQAQRQQRREERQTASRPAPQPPQAPVPPNAGKHKPEGERGQAAR